MGFTQNRTFKNIHFIGVGGVSMSGLAEIMLSRGICVSGSDSNSSEFTNNLISKGANITIGHNAKLPANTDIVVYTAAIPKDNPELLDASAKNIPTMNRAEFLGEIMNEYKQSIAVAGTHGKTTTTSMFSHILLSANLDPTILVGGHLDKINGNLRIGQSDLFITEACEYKRSFLHFKPFLGIILNIDEDHLDYYSGIDEIEDTFLEFALSIPTEGCLVYNYHDERASRVARKVRCNTLSFGLNNGDVAAKNISFNEKGNASFDVIYKEKVILTTTLKTTGEHNILNALSTIASSLFLNIKPEHILNGLESCNGAKKRFEHKGRYNGAIIIDDYAHHPKEIIATIDTVKKIPHKKTYIVFQPHTFTRTLSLLNDFSEAFYGCDELLLLDIYAAREADTGLIDSKKLNNLIQSKGVNCSYIGNHTDAYQYLKTKLKPDDICITMGAGDVVKVADYLLTT